MSEPNTCYVLQQVQQFEGLTRLYQISVHRDMQVAVHKLMTIVLDFIDEVFAGNTTYLEHTGWIPTHLQPACTARQSQAEFEGSDIVPRELPTMHSAIEIDKYLQQYIFNCMLVSCSDEQYKTLCEFVYQSDANSQCLNENAIYEITHGECTFIIMKSYII